ncbi:MAG: GSCFA domain-containing protein [Bacteroidota bacterium]
MTSFRTDVSVTPSRHAIDLLSPVFTIGSCFADAIGKRLTQNKFKCLMNPFGVVYNPHSIHKSLRFAVHPHEPVADHSFHHHQDVHFHFDFHSEISALDKKTLHRKIDNIKETSHNFLKHAQWLFITYGSAWVYTRKDTGEIVANCHKMPAAFFNKWLIQEREIVESFETFYSSVKKLNADVRIILTVSPVRHIKDTLELNNVSKSVLLLSCHSICQKFADVEYFPAYEMMIDDLRDYRFYKSDMLHPTTEAENYIWEKFGERYFKSETHEFLKTWENIRSAIAHKPFHPTSASHQQFIKTTIKRLEELKSFVNVEEEMSLLRSQLIE